MSATVGAGTVYTTGAPQFIPCIYCGVRISQLLVFCVVHGRCVLSFCPLVIALFVLRSTPLLSSNSERDILVAPIPFTYR